MKKASLKATASRQLAEREKFIFDQESDTVPLIDNKGIEVKMNNGIEVQRKEVKKVSCYLPRYLWLKYKTYELDQIKKGTSVSLNSLIVELLGDRLKNY